MMWLRWGRNYRKLDQSFASSNTLPSLSRNRHAHNAGKGSFKFTYAGHDAPMSFVQLSSSGAAPEDMRKLLVTSCC
eukprot:5640534-Amphidinium_carterae.1